MTDFIIRDFKEADLPALAVHFKESIEGWPPGEFVGWDFTPEGVRKKLFRSKRLGNWIAVAGEKIIGFMNYNTHYNEPDSRYIPLLNAQPDYHGIGVGRDLLRTAVNLAVNEGVKRLDLHTWAANNKALPLYKKTGFFWRPRTEDVHMYNFLPTVLRNPIVRDFLGDADWYEHMRQDLSMEESDKLIDGCSYQRYVFEKDGKSLEIHVDPSTAGVTGIVSEYLEIRCGLPGDQHIAGLSYPLKWTFRNKGGKPVGVSINCAGSDFIEYDFQDEFELKDEAIFETSAKLSPSVEPLRIDWWGYPIECKVVVDGVELEFHPGLRAAQPFEIDVTTGPVLLAPGEDKRYTFNLKSHIPEAITFKPEINAEGAVSFAGEGIPELIEIPTDGGFGLQLHIKAGDATGEGMISIGGRVATANQEFDIEPMKVYARVADKNRPVCIRDNNPKKAYLANDSIFARIHREGGGIRVEDRMNGEFLCGVSRCSIGEPFSNEMGSTNLDLTMDERGNEAEAVLRGVSRDFPGMVIEQHIKLTTGNTFQIWLELINDGADPFTGSVKLDFYDYSALSLIAPLTTGLVSGEVRFWLSGGEALPDDPGSFAEPWFAMEGSGGITAHIVRDFDRVVFSPWSAAPSYEWTVFGLQPSERHKFPELTVITRAPDIDCVRHAALGDARRVLEPYPRKFIDVRSPVFLEPGDECRFEGHLARSVPMKGSVEIALPDGQKYGASLDGWDMRNPIEVEVPFENTEPGIVPVNYVIKVVAREEHGQAPIVVPRKDAVVEIASTEEGGYKTFTVDNGYLNFKVSPKYCGALWWLSETGGDTGNLLNTPFPEVGEHTWIKPWYGGISMSSWELDFRFFKSGFDGEPDQLELFGHKWQGVRVDVSLLRSLSTLKMESFYLTLPGIPVIMHLLRFTEPARCRRGFDFFSLLYSRPGGDRESPTSVGLGLEDGSVTVPQNTDGGFLRGRLWASVGDSVSGRTLGLVVPEGDVSLWDEGEQGQSIGWENKFNTHPDRPVYFITYYCLTDDPAKVKLLADELKYWAV